MHYALRITYCSRMNIGIEATSAAEAQKAGVGYYTANLILAMARLRCVDHHYTFYLRKPWSDPLWLTDPSTSLRTGVEHNSKFVSKALSFPYLWAQVRLPFELWRHPQDVYFFSVSCDSVALSTDQECDHHS